MTFLSTFFTTTTTWRQQEHHDMIIFITNIIARASPPVPSSSSSSSVAHSPSPLSSPAPHHHYCRQHHHYQRYHHHNHNKQLSATGAILSITLTTIRAAFPAFVFHKLHISVTLASLCPSNALWSSVSTCCYENTNNKPNDLMHFHLHFVLEQKNTVIFERTRTTRSAAFLTVGQHKCGVLKTLSLLCPLLTISYFIFTWSWKWNNNKSLIRSIGLNLYFFPTKISKPICKLFRHTSSELTLWIKTWQLSSRNVNTRKFNSMNPWR